MSDLMRALVTIRLVKIGIGLAIAVGSAAWAVWECRDLIADWLRKRKGG